MKEYTIVRCSGMPDWNNVPSLQIDRLYKTEPSDIRAWAQLAYDDTALYVKLSAQETHIRAEHMGPLGEICEDSCLEFFFSPMAGDTRYFNIECNPNGAMYLGFGSSVKSLQRLIPEEPAILPQASRTQNGWEVVYQIPYSLIRLFFPDFSPVSGYAMRANCFKCADLSAQPHWLCWSPVVEQPCAFNNPSTFGTMIFQ